MVKRFTLNEYLMKLGFSVDITGANQFLELYEKLKSKLIGTSKLLQMPIVSTTAAVTGLVAAAVLGLGNLISEVASSEKELDIAAKRAYMNKDAYTAMSQAAEALGYSIEDLATIAADAELTEQFNELSKLTTSLQPSQELQDSLKIVRSIQLEFSKINVIFDNGVRFFTMFLTNAAGDKLAELKTLLSEITAYLQANLIPGAKRLAELIEPFLSFAITLVAGIIQKIVALISKFKEVEERHGTLSKAIQVITKALEVAWNLISPALDIVIDALGVIFEILGWILELIEPLINFGLDLINIFGKGLDAVAKGFGLDLSGFILETPTDTTNWLSESLEKLLPSTSAQTLTNDVYNTNNSRNQTLNQTNNFDVSVTGGTKETVTTITDELRLAANLALQSAVS